MTDSGDSLTAPACRERGRHVVLAETEFVDGRSRFFAWLCPCGVKFGVGPSDFRGDQKAEWVALAGDDWQRGGSFYAMASKYLQAAKAKAAGSDRLTEGLDPVLFKDRPALEEFMALLRDDDGKPRDPSCLMVALRASGLAVGLKDEAAGWCWREGRTLAAALNALEKGLQDGTAVFTPAGGRSARRSSQKA